MTASLNPYISQFGEEFDAEKSSQYKMTIQFALGGLSFALLDAETQTLIGLECYQSELLAESNDLLRTLDRALESKGLNGNDFRSVTCLIDHRLCTLVPETLFNENDKASYLDFTFSIPEGCNILSERLENAACFNVFCCHKTLQNKLLSKWSRTTLTHTDSIFIESTLLNKDLPTGVFVNVRNRDFDMIIKKDGQLFFFNNFKFNTKDDFAYFLLFAMEQNGFSGHDTPVCFAGLIRPASEIIELCGRYIEDIRFVEDPHQLQVSKALDEVPYQYYHLHYQALK